jgi:serine/threonine-protein kinase HipA
MPPLAVDLERGLCPSLAGFQRKALVARADDGTANEATCLRLAAACGLEVPGIELLDLDGLGVLAVKRYDRRPCQAVRYACTRKTVARRPARRLSGSTKSKAVPRYGTSPLCSRDFGDPADVITLLCCTAVNMAVGNADAHAKNFQPGENNLSLAGRSRELSSP